jgi:hypothetical protein
MTPASTGPTSGSGWPNNGADRLPTVPASRRASFARSGCLRCATDGGAGPGIPQLPGSRGGAPAAGGAVRVVGPEALPAGGMPVRRMVWHPNGWRGGDLWASVPAAALAPGSSMARMPGFGVSADLAVATAARAGSEAARRGRPAKWLARGPEGRFKSPYRKFSRAEDQDPEPRFKQRSREQARWSPGGGRQQMGSNRPLCEPTRPLENRGGSSEGSDSDTCARLRLSHDPSRSLTLRRTAR